ncbi:Isonitrile hydratase [Leucoagaricus sp. SymC.cos]|nr:Isonitrile hydratase [Leucoagaricus sp. SymC.cos]
MSLVGQTIHIGLVLFPSFQLLDAAGPVDYLNNHSKAYATVLGLPQALVDKATTINWYHIAETLEPVHATSGPGLLPTHTFSNPPSHLDYLIAPGPDPSIQLSPSCTSFLQTTFPKLKGLLTVCTGSIALSQTGILDGLQVCSNKWVMKGMAKAGLLRKGVKWVGDRRWIVDGKVWSGAGVTAGIDLAAEFARVHFDPELVEYVKAVSEETPKPDRPDEWAHLLDGVELN